MIPSVLALSVSSLKLMSRFEVRTVDQYDVYLRQFQQLMQRAKVTNCDDDFEFQYNNKVFQLSLDHDRLIKEPGYEILSYDIGFFDPYAYNRKECNIHFEHQGRFDEFDVYWYPNEDDEDEVSIPGIGGSITIGNKEEPKALPNN